MPSQPKSVSHPRRRNLRISVRTLIVVVLLIGGCLGWIVRSARIQRDPVAAIHGAGGSFTYDWELKDGKSIPGGKPWAPRWLTDLIGVDFFGHVTTARFPWWDEYGDAAIEQVGWLTQLEELRIELDVGGEEGRAHMEGPANAAVLGFGRITVAEAGLAHLDGLKNLSVLSLTGHPVTDAGLAHLKGLTKLTKLDLSETQVSDAGLEHLKGLTNLTELDLRSTRVSDAGLVHLMGLTKLSVLGLEETRVTDAGLAHLKGLTNLSKLDVLNTKVTEIGATELRNLLPRLRIDF
jgi:internalin A